MSGAVKVVRTIEVPLDPPTAFTVFTEEISKWYESGPYSWNDRERAIGVRLEPGVGGRLIEVWRDRGGEGYEMGRITAWEPGRRLMFAYHSTSLPPIPSEVEVRFEPIPTGTRVTLEHRGLELPPSEAKRWRNHAWIQFMQWFSDYARARAKAR
jgi:uncharacterized protein YndB with AHSA1/START domain